MPIELPDLRTNVNNITCTVENETAKTFSCAVLNDDEKFYLLEFQLDIIIRKINLLTYSSYFKFKLLIGGALSLSKKFVAVTGQDLSYRKRQLLIYDRNIKEVTPVQKRRVMQDDYSLKNDFKIFVDYHNTGRILQKQITPENPYMFYSVDLPVSHSDIPLQNYQFMLLQKLTDVPNPDTKSDVKTIQQAEDLLLVQTLSEPGLAKLYKIQEMEVSFKRMGYYELLDLKKVQLKFEGGVTPIKKGIVEMFFSVDSSTDINTQDKNKWTPLWNFFKSLKWVGIVLGFAVGIMLLLTWCYCMRREKLKFNRLD